MKNSVSTNWTIVLQNVFADELEEFANGTISGRQLYSFVTNTEAGPEIRRLLRERGVNEARRLARKALSRR